MPSFNYVSGNPSNLTAGGAANMADLQGPFTDLRSSLNGGLDEVNVPNLAAAFTTYKRLHRAAALLSTSPGVPLLLSLAAGSSNVQANTAAATPGNYLIEIDPTDFNANARTTKLRVKLAIVTNAVAPTANYTAGLYPIATYGGPSAAEPIIASLGTVITGSTAVVATPAASSRTVAVSTDFNCPAAGAYVLACVLTGGAVGSVQDAVAFLEMRQV